MYIIRFTAIILYIMLFKPVKTIQLLLPILTKPPPPDFSYKKIYQISTVVN